MQSHSALASARLRITALCNNELIDDVRHYYGVIFLSARNTTMTSLSTLLLSVNWIELLVLGGHIKRPCSPITVSATFKDSNFDVVQM